MQHQVEGILPQAYLSLVIIYIGSRSTKYKNNMESAIALQVYPFQVSGKEPKLLSQDKSKLLKGFNQTELDFYEAVFHPTSAHPCQTLRPFLPAFHGKLQLQTTPSLQIEKESENEWLSHLASRYKERN